MDRCPVCGKRLKALWENEGKRWWAGVYLCEHRSRQFAASGSRYREIRIVRSWKPECPHHGFNRVIRTGEDAFRCLECGRKFEVRNGRLITTVQQSYTRAVA